MPAVHSRRLTYRAAAAALLLVTLAAPALAAPPATWALAPTRIRVYLSAEASPEWPAARRAELARELSSRAQSLAGALWQLDVVESPKDLAAAARAGLDRAHSSPAITKMIESTMLAPEGPNKESFDKFVFLHLASGKSGEEVQAREWDAYTGTWSPVIVRPAPAGGLLHAAFAAVRAACGTVARIELAPATAPGGPPAAGAAKAPEATPGRVSLRVRGGDLTPRDGSLSPAQSGDVFRVVRRTASAPGKLAASQELPWTYLTVDKVTGAYATCRVHSHFKDPLGQSLAPREEWVALGIGNTGQSTSLRVAGAPPPGTPVAAGNGPAVAGIEVLTYAPTGGKAISLGRTGRDGSIRIAPAESALRVLLLKRGPDLVARYPLVPGWPASAEVTLSGDDTRLAVATSVAAIELRLLELVTRREIELARLRTRVKAKRKVEAEEMMKGFQAFDASRAELEKWIGDEKNRLTTGDPETQAHVNQVFAALTTAVAKHLDPGAIQQLATEMAAPEGTTGGQPVLTEQDPKVKEALTQLGCAIGHTRALESSEWMESVLVTNCDDANFPKAVEQIKLLKNVTRLVIRAKGLTDKSLPLLKEIPGIVSLEVHESGIGPGIFAGVSDMPNLIELTLVGKSMRGPWAPLSKLTQLRTFFAPHAPLAADAATMQAMTQLTYFGCAEEVKDDALAELGKITTLASLAIPLDTATDNTLAQLKALVNLKALQTASDKITDAGLGHLSGMTALETLTLASPGVTDNGLARLSGLTALKTLRIEKAKITDSGLAHLKGLANLKYLGLRETAISGSGFTNLAGLPNLSNLDLAGQTIADSALSTIATLPAINTLKLVNTKVTDAGLAALKPMTRLVWLDMTKTPINGSGLAGLNTMVTLETLILTGTMVDDANLTHVAALPSVKVLALSESKVTPAGLPTVAKMTTLKELELAGLPLPDTSLDALKVRNDWEMLDLSKTQVTDAAMTTLAGFTSLRVLALNGIPLTDKGLETLKPLAALEQLDLNDTKVTDASANTLFGFAKLNRLEIIGTVLTPDLVYKLRYVMVVIDQKPPQ